MSRKFNFDFVNIAHTSKYMQKFLKIKCEPKKYKIPVNVNIVHK